MGADPVKKSKAKAAGLVLLFAFSAIVALRIHRHHGDDVKTQADAPDDSDAAPYVPKEGELNAAGVDYAHRQAKEVTKVLVPSCPASMIPRSTSASENRGCPCSTTSATWKEA